MADMYFDAIFVVDVVCQVFCAVDTPVLAACTAEGEHEVGKTTLNVALYVHVSQFVDIVEIGQNLTVVFQETDDGLVQSCEVFVRFIASRVACAAAVKDIAAAIATGVFGDSFVEAETVYTDYQRTLVVVFGVRR